MSTAPVSPATHTSQCGKACGHMCVCPCRSLQHQSNILRLTVSRRRSTKRHARLLRDLYGDAFTTCEDPLPGQRVRPGRNWKDALVNPTVGRWTGKSATQVEQRLVDVTLRGILQHVHAVPPSAAWLDFVGALCLRKTWRKFTAAVGTPPDGQSGYSWAGMLAATIRASHRRVSAGRSPVPGQTDIATVARTRSPGMRYFARWLLVYVTGVTITADLWKHPAACRYRLLPAVQEHRGRGFGFSLSNVYGGLLVEVQIDQVLADAWRVGGAW